MMCGQTGQRGPVVDGAWLDWAEGTCHAWGMAGLGTGAWPDWAEGT